MLFNSPLYIFLFLPVVALVYFALNQRRLIMAGKIWLVLASLCFYGYWKPEYLLLVISSIFVNYIIGRILYIASDPGSALARRRRLVLIVGLAFNLALLGYFKYADFFIENINWISGSSMSLLELTLPLAISFFTFQQIAYLVDCYQIDTPKYSFLNYCLFVTFFPQLIAGPIVHHNQMMPQFSRLRNNYVNWNQVLAGVVIFGVGLFKKVVIADTFAGWADAGFDNSGDLSFFSAWGASLSYTFQLYYDFSGYSDMAVGAALIFNIHLPINFNSPYKASSIQDFWRRWHMTLSIWLRDYVYIPLGGNRNGHHLTYVNLGATFLLGGLWHGAGWTFVIWGAMHGFAVAVHRLWFTLGLRMPMLLGWFCTFFFINITWVFFRAETLVSATEMMTNMFSLSSFGFSLEFLDQASALTSVVLHNALPLSMEKVAVSEWSLVAAAFALIAVLSGRNMMEKRMELIELRHFSYSQVCLYSVVVTLAFWVMFGSSSEVFLYFNF